MDWKELAAKIKNGYLISRNEALELASVPDKNALYSLANELREHFSGNHFDICSIMNARSGRCSEDCKWCAQSRHYHTDTEIYPLVTSDEAVALAAHNAKKGVHRFSLVTSGRTMSPKETEKACEIYKNIQKHVDIKLCASMGLLEKEELQVLYDSGVKRYHCNLETAPSFFPKLCTTHTTEDKLKTIRYAKEVGMEICSGGIIGMGESMEQRIEFAFTLRETGVDSIPINILTPIKGTPLENTQPLTDEEILTTVALFRIINPATVLRLAGGRKLVAHIQKQLLHSGINAVITGDMLTTSGYTIETDKTLISESGYIY
ncbi:MAG TPA: biotin synthase BioB [Candidatus Avirikenella pullistercoris]|nr:biotin synthase BioB [Candidatus Avirikenella pullistercoris]